MDLKNPTRTEALLANIAGYTGVPVPDMKNATRSERLLKEILDNGGGGGGGDVTKEYVDSAIADAVTAIDEDISDITDAVENKVDKDPGKGLSTNDYTDADKALVQDSPITVKATASPISTANGKPRKLTIYGKSEIVDGAIKSAGEGWSVVRLADLTWNSMLDDGSRKIFFYTPQPSLSNKANGSAAMICTKYRTVSPDRDALRQYNKAIAPYNKISPLVAVRDDDYTTVSDFVASLGDATLCYKLADPTQGNCIAIKTDDGTGIDGTMATFSTGTPLYGVSDTVRDVMTWDGSSGEVMKNCGSVKLSDLTIIYDTTTLQTPVFAVQGVIGRKAGSTNILLANYTTKHSNRYAIDGDMQIATWNTTDSTAIAIRNDTYTSVADFISAEGDKYLIYELATPTTEQLTTAENDGLSALKTYSPQTAITINDSPEFEIEAYANTANGQAISDMQPTRSPLLTLSASGWTNNAQTVTYEHDIGKRNTIDVEPASIKAWTAAGILATAETASTITFECDTTPTADLSFRVTSMEVR